jgi:Flp pilus assembly protein TadD
MSDREAARLAAQAARHHQAGRVSEAERLYRSALALAPRQAESLHGLGCLSHEAGRPDLAIGLIGQAVAAAPMVAAYTLSLGLALLDRGHVEEARAALHVAVLRDASDPRAHRALAQALSRLGRLDEAEARLREALRLDAGAAAWLSLGGVLRARGDRAGSVAAFAEAARLAPDDPLAWHALASAHGAAGALAEAEAGFRRVAAMLPGDAAAQANLGTALFALDRLEEARDCLLRARALAPDNPVTLSGLGLVLMGLGGTVEAEAVLARAHGLAPDADSIAINHGTALAALERRDEAEALSRAVLSRDASNAEARFNLATMLLSRGALEVGWAAFEARQGLIARNPASLPEWDGTPLDHGRVLIQAEQGLGDSIQFLRWVAPAASRAGLALELPTALLRLVREAGLFDLARVRLLAPGEAAEGCVAQASLLSLPHLLGRPVPPPMSLRADPGAVQAWRARLPPGLRVGLAWAGSASYRFDRQRSIGLHRLAPLAAVAGVHLVSLQQGPAASQASGSALILPEAPFEDLAETAALIASLDLVISVDTAVAHLAGALGRPVWLLDRFGGDWRWGTGFASGRDWYPTLRRFAQQEPQEWDAAITQVAGCLAELAGQGCL